MPESEDVSDNEINYSSVSDDEEKRSNEFVDHFKYKIKRRSIDSDFAEIRGSIEGGPGNPINYSGTQINVRGIPPPDLTSFLDPKHKQPNLGYLTDQMLKVNFRNFFSS